MREQQASLTRWLREKEETIPMKERLIYLAFAGVTMIFAAHHYAHDLDFVAEHPIAVSSSSIALVEGTEAEPPSSEDLLLPKKMSIR